MAEKFDLQKRLGSGYFGEVWLANETALARQVALKLVHKSKILNPNNLFDEAQLLAAASHDNVVDVLEAGYFDTDRIYISMEYLKKGSLEDEASGGFADLSRTKRVMVDVLRGLAHLHNNEIVHRDIKPANILIGNNSEAKLSDFGLARSVLAVTKSLGVKDYNHTRHLAPEVWLGGQYTKQSDIYAAGMTFYRLVNGDAYLPSVTDIRSGILNGTYPDRERTRAFVTKPVKAIIKKALSIEPSDRYENADAMRTAIEKISTEINWHETTTPNGMQWSGTRKSRCYYVTLIRNGKLAELVVTQGSSKHTQRRMLNLCIKGIAADKAMRMASRILQDLVLGKMFQKTS